MKKLFKWVFVIIIFLQAAVLVAGVVIFRMPLPDHEIDVSGLPLTDFVEIIRDERGIPHIYGTNVDDILFAQGYVHAQDRFWQLEFWSHLSTGRLASLIGEPGVGADLLFRTFGFNRVALERYTDYKAHEDHFKTKQWEHFSGVMEKYPPRNIEVKTYEAREVPHALD